MYSKADREQIRPDIELCDQLSRKDNQDMAKRTQSQLEQYVDNATREIARLYQNQQSQTTDELRQSIESLEQGLQTIQDSGMQLDPAAQKAVRDGAAANTTAVQARFDQYQAARKELATL